jgi:phosphonate transport system substrate-binding protein
VNWYLGPLKKYTDFSGRASRKEYWLFFLWNMVIAVALALLIGEAYLVYSLLTLLPSLAVWVRRLHDTNRNGWWILIGFVPLVGNVVMLVFLCSKGTDGTNDYGPAPIGGDPRSPKRSDSPSEFITGSPRTETTASTPSVGDPTSDRPPFCENCGKRLATTATFCGWCGQARPHMEGTGEAEAPAGKGDPEAGRAVGDVGEEPLLSGPVDGSGGSRRSLRVVLLVLVVGAVVAGIFLVRALDDSWPDKITFGFVPSWSQAQNESDVAPVMAMLEQALGIEVEPVIVDNYTDLVAAMKTGKADLGAFGPFGYAFAKEQAGRTWWNPYDWVRSIHNMDPLIQAIRYGSPTYHGQWMTTDPSICDDWPQSGTALENANDRIFQVGALDAVALQVGVHFDESGKALGEIVDAGPVSSGTSCIADLSKVKGKRVAFTSESSTSGYLFPSLQLIQAGIDPVTDIIPIFTGGHDRAVTAVYNGDADIGVSYDDARRSLRKEKLDVGEKVIVFNLTPEIPNDVVAASSRLSDSLQTAVYDAISAYLMTEEGEAAFNHVYGWTDMRRAVESDFDIVREAIDALDIDNGDAP